MNRRLFFGSLVGLGAATSVQVDAERQPEPIREGDVLVIEHPAAIGEEAYRNIAMSAHHVVPTGVKVLILEEGMKAKLLRPEAAKALLED